MQCTGKPTSRLLDLPKSDQAGRYGGEEFLVLRPETGQEEWQGPLPGQIAGQKLLLC